MVTLVRDVSRNTGQQTLSSSESSSKRTRFFSRGSRSFSFTLMAKQMGAKDAERVERKEEKPV